MRRVIGTAAFALLAATACIAAALALLAATARTARAGARPELAATVGNTFAVLGVPDAGGYALSLAALWPIDELTPGAPGLRFGVMVLADDMGSKFGTLRDPNDGTPLGATEFEHRWAYGAGWRADAMLSPGPGWTPFVSGTWGYYRVEDDHLGIVDRAVSSLGFSLGAGVRRTLSGRHALGVSVRYHRLLNDLVGRYVGAAADWSWRWESAGSSGRD